jgi:RHS repeat-associated protein
MGDTDLLKENCVIMTEDYYYNTDWKCVEERDSGETCPRKQYAYGIRGRNDLVARDNYRYNSSSGSPSCSSAGKERHYELTDAMGSVTAITGTTGDVVERYSYTAFGQSQVMDKDFINRSLSSYDWQTRFHGETRDEETGFYNYGYRYYDPTTGRWPSRDPMWDVVREEPTAWGVFNLYSFVNNEAINWYDFLGFVTGTFDSQDEAAKAALKEAWNKTVEEDKKYREGGNPVHPKAKEGHYGNEWCGRICCKDKKFYYTGSVTLGKQASCKSTIAPCPEGYTDTGSYHTHPGGGPPSGEKRNDGDFGQIDDENETGYVTGPGGVGWKYGKNPWPKEEYPKDFSRTWKERFKWM